MIMDQSQLETLLLIISSISAGIIVAIWGGLIIWTYRDIRSRTRDRIVHILASSLVFLLNLPGWVIYLIMRPRETLDEKYQKALEEESLLQIIEEPKVCPGCERQIDLDWIICPTCQTILRKSCHKCGKLLEIGWNICPYCSIPVPGMRNGLLQMSEGQKSEETN